MRKAKRFLDILFSIIALVFLLPAMAFISIVIKITSKGPILFKQERPGKNLEIFTLYKFRTMHPEKTKTGELLPKEKRITKIGSILRSLSLDEIPGLWNVIKGEMSLVGPRPLLIKYIDRYTPEQSRRHETKPGITGWAQIKGRNAISWEEKFRYDLWYIENWSLWLDFRILCTTVVMVIKRQGINQPGYATVQEFKGRNDKT